MTQQVERSSSLERAVADRQGPVSPTAGAVAAVRPLAHDAVELREGWLGEWQRRTLTATLPHVLDRVEDGEARSNLARLTGESDAPLVGMFFTDTDVYKAVEAVAWASTRLPADDALVVRAQALVDLVRRAQEPDGYVNSRVQGDPRVDRWSDPQWGHELYTLGHLLQASVAAARTGSLPGALEAGRAMADLVVELFGPSGRGYVEGHPEVETALVELYRLTGHTPYLATAARQLELRGHGWLGEDKFGSSYFQDAVPVLEAEDATGHAVRQLYLLTGAVDVAVETGDTELLAAAVRVWEDLEATKTYVTGAHGSRHRDEAIGDPYELPPDRAYAESCAAIASFQLAWRLLLATGEARYAETMDVVLHNALAASTSLSGTEFFYSNPLHLRTGHGGEHEDAPTQRLSWFTCACCPPNIARLLASVHDYLVTRSDAGVQLQHHTSGALTVTDLAAAGAPVHLEVDAQHPWGGTTHVAVSTEGTGEWELAVRVPAWASRWTAKVDGELLDATAADGYLRVRRAWTGHHVLELRVEVEVREVTAHPRVDAVRGCVALVRGPVVYALESADLPADVVLEDVRLRRVVGAVAAPEGSVAPVLLEVEVAVERPLTAALHASTPRERVTEVAVVRLVPYHRWANRSPGAMRVWLPLADAPATAGAVRS